MFHQDAQMSLLQTRAFVTGCLWHMPFIVFPADKRGGWGVIIFERMVRILNISSEGFEKSETV